MIAKVKGHANLVRDDVGAIVNTDTNGYRAALRRAQRKNEVDVLKQRVDHLEDKLDKILEKLEKL